VTDALEEVFRREAGRCTATLIRVLGDIDLAEDAVAEAFAIAAEQWPKTGTPPNPGGWITTTARNRAIEAPLPVPWVPGLGPRAWMWR
jgi:RNA polymerase sigma-70 factor (ECF subfamily)